MKRFIKYIFLLAFPFLIVVPISNYYIDFYHTYSHEVEDSIVSIFKSGKNACSDSYVNERYMKKKFIEQQQGKHFKYLILGSSRGMMLSSDALGGECLNACVSSAKLEDWLANIELCKENCVTFDTVIMCNDYYLFNDSYDGNDDNRWKTNFEYYSKYVGNQYILEPMYTHVKNLFSIACFQKIKDVVRKSKNSLIIPTSSIMNINRTWRYDGSYTFSIPYQYKSQKLVDRFAKKNDRQKFVDFNVASEKYVSLYENLLQKLLEQNIEVIFYNAPYHPTFYKWLMIECDGVKETDTVFVKCIKKYAINVIGSFNPVKCGVSKYDFYDESHVAKEKIDSLFISFIR